MNDDPLIDEIDALKNQIHDLTMDKQELEKDLASERRELQETTEECERLAEECSTLEERFDELEVESKKETAQLTEELDAVRREIEHRLNYVNQNYLRALSIAETIRQGNYDYFRDRQGIEFLEWARREFKNEQHKVKYHKP